MLVCSVYRLPSAADRVHENSPIGGFKGRGARQVRRVSEGRRKANRRNRPAPAGVVQTVRFLTLNIHKGRGRGMRLLPLDSLAHGVSAMKPDILLCQEVFHCNRDAQITQSTRLADALGYHLSYAPNARYQRGHHGNATLSRHPIAEDSHVDISTNGLEKRGLLYTRMMIDGVQVHVFNTHLGLNRWQRDRQIDRIAAVIRQVVVHDDPVVLAGDFNDWTGRLDDRIRESCGLESALDHLDAAERRSFPSLFPIFALDRIYYRGLSLLSARVLTGTPFNRLSDHLPVEATFRSRP